MSQHKMIKELLAQKKEVGLKLKIKEKAEVFTRLLFYMLFDEDTEVEETLDQLKADFKELSLLVGYSPQRSSEELWESYCLELPVILQKLKKDAEAIASNDPAANSVEEVYLSYPGFFAIAIYRLSHELNKREFPLVPRLMTECAHKLTGTDINPGAVIGESFFIDHATGVVIGETAIIKNHVKIYQGVTLGALSVERSMRKTKRHPTIEDHVTIYANATILGGDTNIGANSIIGGNAWLTKSVPPNSFVTHAPEIHIKNLSSI